MRKLIWIKRLNLVFSAIAAGSLFFMISQAVASSDSNQLAKLALQTNRSAVVHDAFAVTSDPRTERALKVIAAILPHGWKIAKVETNQIPYGHYWNENYTGEKGLLVVATGIRPVHAEFKSPDGHSRIIHVATEAIDIWLMPEKYRNSRLAWTAKHRPIQPTAIVNRGPFKIFAAPSQSLFSQRQFQEILSTTNDFAWVDSPSNSPKLLTWKDWQPQLKQALETVGK